MTRPPGERRVAITPTLLRVRMLRFTRIALKLVAIAFADGLSSVWMLIRPML